MSKNLENFLVKIFECLKRALEAPRTWDRCRKIYFRSIFGEITYECLKIRKFLVKIFECLKWAPEALEHGIDEEKLFLNRFSAK